MLQIVKLGLQSRNQLIIICAFVQEERNLLPQVFDLNIMSQDNIETVCIQHSRNTTLSRQGTKSNHNVPTKALANKATCLYAK